MSSYTFITDRLAVGDRQSRSNPRFAAVVTVAATERPGILWDETKTLPPLGHRALRADIPCFYVDLAPGESWSLGRDAHRLESYLTDATSYIAAAIERGPVLVHCHEGKERAPAVAAAYLARYAGMSVQNALALVKQQRPIVDVPAVFVQAIKNWSGWRDDS